MPTLRRWRESLGLSRQQVADKIADSRPELPALSQATVAKWESGESAVRVSDLKLLAEIYGTTADRLLFDPGDTLTPELMQRAHVILSTKEQSALTAWLQSGEFLPNRDK